MSSELMIPDNFETTLSQIQTEEDAKVFIKNLDTLKAALEAADMFNAQARKYAKLEAMTYMHIIENGWQNAIPHNRQQYKACLWLATLSPEQREQVVDMCGEEGWTVVTYWKNTVLQEERKETALEILDNEIDHIVESFKRDGEIVLQKKWDSLAPQFGYVPNDFVEAYKDRIRGKIRQAGGHGLHDGDGTYVTVRRAHEKINEVRRNKLDSIGHDIGRLKLALIEAAEEGEDAEDKHHYYAHIKRECNFDPALDEDSIVSVMLCLLGVARPSWAANRDSTLFDELMWMMDQLNISRDWLMAQMVSRWNRMTEHLPEEDRKRKLEELLKSDQYRERYGGGGLLV